MAKIILLSSREPREQAKAKKPVQPGQTAEILLFMGVRYERHEGGAETPAKSTRRTAQKKRA